MSGALICVECGARSAHRARGWRAYLTTDDDVALFCPTCSGREFGLAARPRRDSKRPDEGREDDPIGGDESAG